MGFKKKIDTGQGEQFKFEKIGDQLEGYYVGSFDFEGDYGPTKKHCFQTSEGLAVVFGQTHLTQLLEGVEPSVLVRITLEGEKKPTKKGRRPMKLFGLEYDEEQRMDIGMVAAGASSGAQEPEEYTEGSEEESTEEESAEEEEQEEEPAPRKTARPVPAQTQRPVSRPAAAPSPEAQARVNRLLGKK
jgi:hypothetical protein